MARQYDTGKHGNECYRPIPVHTPNSRRVPASKPYVANVNSSSSEAPPPSAPPPRYDSEYDYKTTHYPSYPPNYPYDDNKYKYEGSGGGGGGGGNSGGGGGGVGGGGSSGGSGGGSGSGQQQVAYNTYNEKSSYGAYEESYDSRGYVPHANATAAPANSAYPSDAEYGSRYYGEGRAYPADNCTEQYDKGRYSNYGYDQRGYYDQTDGRYTVAATDYRYDMRYSDARHSDSRHLSADSGREPDCRYVDSREMDRRYIDGRESIDGRYTMDNREIDGRYATTSDGRDSVDGRYADPARYSTKENYYDRYYKHRPSRDHHVADTSRY